MKIHEKMMKIQTTLKAPKNLFNSFGNYKYRNAEGILEAVKPLLAENKLSMYISDDVQAVNDRVYVKATVSILILRQAKVLWLRHQQEKHSIKKVWTIHR